MEPWRAASRRPDGAGRVELAKLPQPIRSVSADGAPRTLESGELGDDREQETVDDAHGRIRSRLEPLLNRTALRGAVLAQRLRSEGIEATGG